MARSRFYESVQQRYANLSVTWLARNFDSQISHYVIGIATRASIELGQLDAGTITW